MNKKIQIISMISLSDLLISKCHGNWTVIWMGSEIPHSDLKVHFFIGWHFENIFISHSKYRWQIILSKCLNASRCVIFCLNVQVLIQNVIADMGNYLGMAIDKIKLKPAVQHVNSSLTNSESGPSIRIFLTQYT